MMEAKIHDEDSAPKASQSGLEAAKENYGFIPNFIGLISESPPTLQAYEKLNQLFEETDLDERERQVVLLTAAVTNECHYCVPAHTVAATKADLNKETIRAIKLETPLEDEKLEALRNFTSDVVRNRGTASNERLKAFFEAGYTRKHAMEVMVGVSTKTLSNYINHLFNTPVDEKFKSAE